jgi:excisionase family DNA binding protein
MNGTPLLSVREVAERLGCSPLTIYRRVWSGQIPAVQLGRPGSAIRIDPRALEAWLHSEPYEEVR